MKYCKVWLICFHLTTIYWLRIRFVEAIIGGHNAESDQFKYQISLQINNKHICGGSIIDDQHIITAAHCVIDQYGIFFKDKYTILAGIIDLKSQINTGVMAFVEKVYVPKKFKDEKLTDLENQDIGDIAVIKLKNKLILDDVKLSKIDLPKNWNTKIDYENEKAIVTGFGADTVIHHEDEGGRTVSDVYYNFNKLKFAETKVISNIRCENMYEYYGLRFGNEYLCAQVTQNHHFIPEGICNGDSGSPLVVNGNTIIGVAIKNSKDCNEKYSPGIYTRITSYIDFIQKAINDENSGDIRTASYIQKIQLFGLLGTKEVLEENMCKTN